LDTDLKKQKLGGLKQNDYLLIKIY